MLRKIMAFLILSLLLITFVYAQAGEMKSPEPGETRTDEFGIEQVWVPAGCFMMGITEEQAEEVLALEPPSWVERALRNEQPQHEVCLSSGFWIDKYEVTNAAFQAFVDAGGYQNTAYWSEDGLKWLERQNLDNLPIACEDTEPDHPRVCITWFEAEAYANWRGGKLPTEAQWEFAARGPENRIYPWGDEWNPELANVVDSESLTPVGSYAEGASWIGAMDMAGNAMEWVQDWLDTRYYANSPVDDPAGPERGRVKVERGGWWGSNPAVARTTYRHFEDPPTYQDHHIGFRVVSMPESE